MGTIDYVLETGVGHTTEGLNPTLSAVKERTFVYQDKIVTPVGFE